MEKWNLDTMWINILLVVKRGELLVEHLPQYESGGDVLVMYLSHLRVLSV